MRPIVSAIDSPCFKLSKFLLPIISLAINKNNGNYLQNSSDLISKISGATLPAGYILISLDVTSLYTNTPTEVALNILKEKLYEIENSETFKNCTDLPIPAIIDLVSVCLEYTYFEFDNKFYQQNNGLAMGGVLSGILAEIVLQRLEQDTLKNLEQKAIKLLHYSRYIDDAFAAIIAEKVTEVTEEFNKFHPKIQFTTEIEREGQLPYLDILITRNIQNNKLSTSVYRKPTDSGIYLNFNSNQHISVHRSVIYSLINRAYTHCSDDNIRKTELGVIRDTLIRNNYPLNEINKICKKVRGKHKNKNKNSESKNNKKDPEKPITTCTIPYIRGTSDKIRRINSKYNIRTVFKSDNKLRKHIMHTKPKKPAENKKNSVYMIPCECGEQYIGETSRPVKLRINEHKRNVKNKKIETSKLAEHTVNTNHKIIWDQSKIIGSETHIKKTCYT
jgi:predicted GIY-YIG superfamily endonuclease